MACKANVRPQSKPLHDTGSYAFDERNSALDKLQHRVDRSRLFEILDDRLLTSVKYLRWSGMTGIESRTFYHNHFGTQGG
ncbi:hypothetical protein ACVINW_003828 [Bradyrhizobium sp. USDA 4461]